MENMERAALFLTADQTCSFATGCRKAGQGGTKLATLRVLIQAYGFALAGLSGFSECARLGVPKGAPCLN